MSQNTPGTSVYHDTAHGTARVAPVADRPILFSAPMVRALLEGRKTQTRRVLKLRGFRFFERHGGGWRYEQSRHREGDIDIVGCGPLCTETLVNYLPHAVGDRLWVRETLVSDSNDQGAEWMSYAADGKEVFPLTVWPKDRKTIASIHMPRWASRLTLVVTDVRVQRLHDISEDDAREEGMPHSDGAPGQMGPTRMIVESRSEFEHQWRRNHGPGSWEANPFVAAYTFTVHHCNIDTMPAPTAAAAE